MTAKRVLFVLAVSLLLTLTASTGFAQSGVEPEAAPQLDRSQGGILDVLEQQKRALAGTWQVVADPLNPPPGFPAEFRALHTFTEDGRFIETSATNPLLKSPAHGEWRYEGGRQFSATFLFYVFDPAGNHAVTVKVRALITLNERGDEWSGPVKFDVLTPDGNPIMSGTGSQSAKRVVVNPF
jgi:hypothetical protein